MINYINHIEANPEIMFGKPCIKGTRVPVDLILEKLKDGYSYSDLLDAYPRIKLEDIEACLLFEKDGKNIIGGAELEHNALITAYLVHSKAFLGDYYKNTEGS
jgi:uncharacterized protein (DUF433 family)